MKKNLLYVVALVLSMGFFASCSDDDSVFDDISTEYKGDKLAIKLNGADLSDKTVVLYTHNPASATVVIKNIIPGEDSLVMTGVVATETELGVTFSGEDVKANNRTVTIAGIVKDGVLGMDVTLKMTAPIVGKWNFPTLTEEGPHMLHMAIKNATDSVYMWEGVKVSNKEYADGICSMFSSVTSLFLFDVTFKEDGNLVATYNAAAMGAEPIKAESPLGAVKYYIKDNRVHLVPNLSIIVPTGRATNTPNIEGMLTAGIPLYLRNTDNGMQIYVDKAMIEPFLPIVDELLNSDIIPKEFLVLAQMYYDPLKTIITESTTFELGLNLEKAK